MKHYAVLLLLVLCGHGMVAQPLAVSSTQIHSDPRTGLTVVGGIVALPAEGGWEIEGGTDRGGLGEIFVEPPADLLARIEGDRLGRINDRRTVEQGRQQLTMIFWACRQYANEHQNRGPDSFDELDPEQMQWIPQRGALRNFALVPRVHLPQAGLDRDVASEREPLAFEVRPMLDDGKHWVLWNDGVIEREAIDAQRLDRYGLMIESMGEPRSPRPARSDGTVQYRLLARKSGNLRLPVALTLHDRFSERRLEIEWLPDPAQPAGPELLRDWARLRIGRWRALDDPNSASVLGLWLRQAPALYGMESTEVATSAPRNPANQTTVFNVLGGRAAIQETLQLQAIVQPGTIRAEEPATIPIAGIEGVRVKAHDYEAMLAGTEGAGIPLADLVPAERFFAWFPRPSVLLQFLDGGTDFLFGLSSGFTGSSLQYALSERYLARLGLNEELMRVLLESGALSEVAVILPDLHFIDGTDLTVIARVAEPVPAAGALKLLGLGDLKEITPLALPDGETVYWLRRGDLLLISSHRAELEQILDFAKRGGDGSLGRSAEFRYMLTQLPPRDATRAFFYFSDPFIRRLTGPASKIGQLRRMTMRAQLEAISAGALLYQVDHAGAQPEIEVLADLGYAPVIGGLDTSLIDLDDQLVARSRAFGQAGRMRTLLDRPVVMATPAEARAYETYRENYERFWRQFFDPIAIRLDQTDAGRMEIETFILPLIDSSIYTGFRRAVAPAESRVPLRVPLLDPEPVAMLSANLTEDTWIEWLHDWDELFVQVLGRDSALLDQFGPGIHLALADGDPVLSTGSGDLAGIFGGGAMRSNNEMLFLPAAISLLTRPASVLVELRDPDVAVRELSRLATGAKRFDPGFLGLSSALYRVTGEQEWIYTLSVGGVMKLRFGLNVQGRYLVLSNQPLSHRPRLLEDFIASQNGMRLELRPGAVVKLGPSLRLATMEQQREAALEGSAMLYPLLLSGAASADEAARRHQTLFGFAPLHPPGGAFEWKEGIASSTLFGRPGAEQQPAFDLEESEVGILRQIKDLNLNLQFEQDGLRIRCGWTVRR